MMDARTEDIRCATCGGLPTITWREAKPKPVPVSFACETCGTTDKTSAVLEEVIGMCDARQPRRWMTVGDG